MSEGQKWSSPCLSVTRWRSPIPRRSSGSQWLMRMTHHMASPGPVVSMQGCDGQFSANCQPPHIKGARRLSAFLPQGFAQKGARSRWPVTHLPPPSGRHISRDATKGPLLETESQLPTDNQLMHASQDRLSLLPTPSLPLPDPLPDKPPAATSLGRTPLWGKPKAGHSPILSVS